MEKFRRINKEHRNANIHSIFAYSVFFPVVEIILAMSTGLLVWWAASRAMGMPEAEALVLSGKIISFILLINLISRPLRVIADKFNVLQMGMVASDRVFKVLDNDDYLRDKGHFAPPVLSGKINFDKVWFAYVEERYVLKDVSF